MSAAGIGYRDRATLPLLGVSAPSGPLLLDTNVFINALTGRGPPELRALLGSLPLSFVSGATIAELNWARGRLDPAQPDTARVIASVEAALAQIPPARVLAPFAAQWADAGVLAGRSARAVAGRVRSIRTAFDRIELINDAVTAVVALAAGATVVTQDGDFDLFMQLEPALDVLFYD
jgi:predicted nucleic acid-binding protein